MKQVSNIFIIPILLILASVNFFIFDSTFSISAKAQSSVEKVPSASSISNSPPFPELLTQQGHSQVVQDARFSPDDRFVATCSQDGAAIIWDRESAREIRRFIPKSSWVRPGCNSIAFSPNGNFIATGNNDRVARLWDIKTGNVLQLFEGHTAFVKSIAFSPDGKTLATASSDKTARLWDISTGKEKRKYEGHSDQILSVVYSPDGRNILTGGLDGTARLWDTINTAQSKVFDARSGKISSVAFVKNGNHIITSGEDSNIRVWDVFSGRMIQKLVGHTKQVASVDISPDGTLLASAAWDNTARLWDLATGHEIRQYSRHPSDISSVFWSINFSHNGMYLLAGCNDHKAALFLVSNAIEIRGFESPLSSVMSVSFSPDATTVLTAGDEQTARLWSLKTGRLIQTFRGHTRPVATASFSADGRSVLTSSWDGTARIWNIASGSEISRFNARPGSFFTSGAFSPDGRRLVTGSARMTDNSAELWDVATGIQIGKMAHAWPVQLVAFSPNGHWLVTGGSNTAILWDLDTGAEVRRFAPSETSIAALDISPDGKYLIIGDLNRSARVLRINDGKIVQEYVGATGDMQRLKFSHDGDYIISGGMNGIAVVRKVNDGTKIASFVGNQNYIGSVALSPNGLLALTGGNDGSIRIWSVENGSQIAQFSPFRDGGWAIVAQDGRVDTNQLDGAVPLNWIMSDQPLTPLPLEIYMRDYYEPRLLPRLLACHDEEDRLDGDKLACQKAFKPVRPLAQLNRIQPDVRILRAERGTSADEVVVTVEVVGKADPGQKNGKVATAAYDLRLFRDGQIVGQSPEPKAGIGGAEEITAWQAASLVAGTENQGRVTRQFPVKLAAHDMGQAVAFTAYAFNEDRVKSETARFDRYNVPDDIATPKPRAYVVTIGVNAYQNPAWTLGFAAGDARALSSALRQIEGYEVVSVPLVSLVNPDSSKLDHATKRTIADVVALLNGHDGNRARLRDQLGLIVDELKKATPDDLVILGFSGHGYTDKQGRFYLLPSDSGEEALTDPPSPDRLARFISSDELSQWLRDVDAGEMVMVIDACHSAASVPEEFKPGPMGDRGLGQLAYDKGMEILAATQADNVALESETLGQGLLTYALVHDGLKHRRAAPDGGGPITLKGLMHYAETRVPRLYDEMQAGTLRAVGFDASATQPMARQLTAKDPSIDKVFLADTATHAQIPTLFDFFKGKTDPVVGIER